MNLFSSNNINNHIMRRIETKPNNLNSNNIYDKIIDIKSPILDDKLKSDHININDIDLNSVNNVSDKYLLNKTNLINNNDIKYHNNKIINHINKINDIKQDINDNNKLNRIILNKIDDKNNNRFINSDELLNTVIDSTSKIITLKSHDDNNLIKDNNNDKYDKYLKIKDDNNNNIHNNHEINNNDTHDHLKKY